MALASIDEVLGFLTCRTPPAWVAAAMSDLPTLLRDHAALELKAAQQAQRLIWKYGMRSSQSARLDDSLREHLRAKLSRLAREELRHFEQVLEISKRRGIVFEPVSASRYAAALHERIAETEPDCLIDTLIVGGVIEARSCERFHALIPGLEGVEPELAAFYASLLKSEARHFIDYLDLARAAATKEIDERLAMFLAIDAELVVTPDEELRFHSGVRGASA